MSSKGTSAPPETSSASCHAASSTKAARESCRARLCMRGWFAPAGTAPPARTRTCSRSRGRNARSRPEGAIFGPVRRTEPDSSGRDRLLDRGGGLLHRTRGVLVEPLAPVDAHRLDDRDQRAALLG